MKLKEYSGDEAINRFNLIRHWLADVLDKSSGYTTMADVWRLLSERHATLWLLFSNENDLIGFATTEPLMTTHGPWVNIPFAYCKGGDYKEFFDRISLVAYERGMTGVKFISYRDGFKRVAEKYGWKRGYTEYIVSDFRGGEE